MCSVKLYLYTPDQPLNQATLVIRPLHVHHLGGRGRGLQFHPYVPSGISTNLMLLYTRGLSRAVSHRLLAALAY